MNKSSVAALSMLLLLIPPLAVQGQYKYVTNDNAITITKYTGSGSAVTIPDKINGLPVTNIGPLAFIKRMTLTSVTIPNTVVGVGESAFQQCANLTSVTIPNSVTTIGLAAFWICDNLTNAVISASVSSIGMRAFNDCTKLTKISVNASNSVYCSVDGVLFNKDKTILIEYPIGKAGSTYAIPNSVASIGQMAFEGCANLTNMTIPNGVTDIGQGAFYCCRNLSSVSLPNSVTNIGAVAFYMCGELTKITIPAGVATIENGAFQDCCRLSGVYFQGDAPSLGSYVFECRRGRNPEMLLVYYLPGTKGWGKTFGGSPTALWTEK